MKLGDFVILGIIDPCYSRGAGIIEAKACFLSCQLETHLYRPKGCVFAYILELYRARSLRAVDGIPSKANVTPVFS